MNSVEELAQRALAGDRAAEGKLIAALRPGVVSILRCGPFRFWIEAEDIAQDALQVLVVRLRAGTISDPAKVTAFLAQTARKLALNAARKGTRQQTVVDSELVELTAQETYIESAEQDDEQLAHAVAGMIDQLTSDRDRRLLLRFYIDGVDKGTLCREMGLSHQHFDRLLYRARARFRDILERDAKHLGLVPRISAFLLPVALVRLFAGL
jgi:RNA polymerase sigma-70 factor (ECF subfamily)